MIRAQGGASGKAASGRNTYTRPGAHGAKAELRRNVLAQVRPAHVFDAFCGPTGEMWQKVWREAESYVGCDTEFELSDPRLRFVADNRRVLRSIDLQPFNVFDFDAFGSPWEQMLILAARRKWALGETGGAVLTDGSSMKTRWSELGRAQAQLLRCGMKNTAPCAAAGDSVGRLCLTAWTRLARVRPVKLWQAQSRSSGVGSVAMSYTAVVFDGTG